MNNLLTILVFFSVFFSSCSVIKFARYYASADNSSSGKLSGQVYESKDTIYEIGKLSDKWKRINIKGGDLAFWDEAIQATITVNSTCNIKANYSLKALSNYSSPLCYMLNSLLLSLELLHPRKQDLPP